MMRRLLTCLTLAAALGCGGSTGTEPAVSIAGRWRYSGTQTNPRNAQLSGTLDVRQQQGQAFDGTMAIQVTDLQGGVRVIQGLVTGVFAGGSVIDFDLSSSDGILRHVGTLSGDTLRGSWASSDNVTAGTFRAVREAP